MGYFFSDKEIDKFQQFSQDSSFLQKLRLFFCFPLLFDIILGYVFKGDLVYMCFFTMQGVFFTFLSLFMSFLCTYQGQKASRRLKEWTLFTFSSVLIFEVMICCIYWGFTHWKIALKQPETQQWPYFLYLCEVHITPMVAVSLNFYLSKRIAFKMTFSTFKVFFFYGVFYLCCNYLGQQYRGKALYPFTDWENPLKAIFSMALIAFVIQIVYWQVGKWTLRKYKLEKEK